MSFEHAPHPSLTHNPNADHAERLRYRETFSVRDHLHGKPPERKVDEPVHVTKEQVLILCRFYGIDVVDPNDRKSGRDLNLEERYLALQAENVALLERAKLSEMAAANAIRDLRAAKAGAMQPSAAEATTEETPNA